ncbi:MAG: KEOPS complex subunit Pcc1 [Halobacteriales archaeon]
MAEPTRRATIRTTVDAPAIVATAIRPDNTDEMATMVTDGTVCTTIERDTTGGLQSTVDDYVVNLEVATRVIDSARRHAPAASTDMDRESTADTDTDTDTDTDADTNTKTDTTTETNEQQ